MSILSSTGTGRELAQFLIYYNRREQFYKEYENDTLAVIFGGLKTYSKEELQFIIRFIKKYGWTDIEFVKKIEYVSISVH